jgi:dTDP-4-dehydrorhamnose 3,5-epimerase
MFEIKQSLLEGCFEVVFNQKNDNRGHFIKSFHIEDFKTFGIEMPFKEEYFTYSHKNVFRGLHFQNPPKAIAKMVYCVSGHVTDYVIDIRAKSATYGQYHVFELDGNKPKMVYVPEGFAHGFFVRSEHALMQYKVSDVFDAACDTGIDYQSFDFAKDIVNPIMSDRDQSFVKFFDFKSLFK